MGQFCALIGGLAPRRLLTAGIAALLPCIALSCVEAAAAEEKEPSAVFEVGAAAEWEVPGGGASFGPEVAVEFAPVKSWKDWLVLEVGVSPLFSRGQTEWDTDLVFKKPFDLSPTVEFEPGVGPVWIHTVADGRTTDAIGGEVIFEFMIWPTRERTFGWFVEPSYTIDFSKGQQSMGITAGLLIAIP